MSYCVEDTQLREPNLWIPGKKPIGLVEATGLLGTSNSVVFPCQKTMVNITPMDVGAFSFDSTSHMEVYQGDQALITGGTDDMFSGVSWANEAMGDFAMYYEGINITSDATLQLFQIGDSASMIARARKSTGLDLSILINASVTLDSTVTNFVSDGDKFRFAFTRVSSTEIHWMGWNLTSGAVIDESRPRSLQKGTSTSGEIRFSNSALSSDAVYFAWATTERISVSYLRDLVFKDPYQFLVPA